MKTTAVKEETGAVRVALVVTNRKAAKVVMKAARAAVAPMVARAEMARAARLETLGAAVAWPWPVTRPVRVVVRQEGWRA